MRKGVLLLLVLLAFLSVRANNVQLQETVKIVSATGGLVTMEVNLSWENSWRDEYNWDAVWLFFKYKVGVDGAWQHATINTTGATVTAMGSDYTTMSATTGATAQGLFVYPSKVRGGNTDSLKVLVQWAASHTEEQFKNNDVFVVAHGIEMVYIPYGTYTIGDGSSASSFTKTVIDSEAIWNGASANFPKGYQGFYVMKYETSQEQYVEFLNALTLTEQTALIPGVDTLNVGDFVFGSNKTAPNNRNGVVLLGKIVGKSLRFDNNLNNNTVYSEDGDGGTLAMNYMSITDACGYASWAGLRPMTEMEYEKACRRPYPQEPDAGEYAWNSATGAVNAEGLTMQGSGREITATGNVNAGGTMDGPVRCGIFARPTTANQAAAGATYWGVMEMSGNVSELCANITNTTISKTGNGTGAYNASLFGTVPNSYGTRGGGFIHTHLSLTTSSRDAVSCFTNALQRDSTVGFRCVSTYNGESGVDAGTINASLATVCLGDSVIFSGTPATAGALKIMGYSWSVKIGTGAFTVIPGENEETLTYTGFEAGKSYIFQRKATCLLGENSVETLSLTILSPVSITSQPTHQNANCSLTFTLSASGSAPLFYQWHKNGTPVGGATVATYTKSVTVASDAGTYHCMVTNSCGSLSSTQAQATIHTVINRILTDPRDGKQYRTRILADGREWMVENLRFGTCNANTFYSYHAGSVQHQIAAGYYGSCIDKQQGFGYLYNWQGAMNSANAYHNTSSNPSGNVDGNSTRQWQGICPPGWHLPSGGSTGEFKRLYDALCNRINRIYPGTDDFQAVAAGWANGTNSGDAGGHGFYWSSTYYGPLRVYIMSFAGYYVSPMAVDDKFDGFSVRCVKNY